MALLFVWEAGLGKTRFGSTVGLIINPALKAYRRLRLGKGESENGNKEH